MKSYPNNRLRFMPAALALTLVLTAAAHASTVVVNVTHIPAGMGTFLYSVTFTNNGTEDLALLTFTDGIAMDSLIEPSFTSPSGFSASYDSGLGLISFAENGSPFTVGGTFGAFTFTSAAVPGTAFTMYEANDVMGGTVSGSTNIIPEPATTGLIALAFLPAVLRRRRLA